MAPDTEIANQTDFLTSSRFEAKIEVQVWPAAPVESLLVSSDGLDSHLVGRGGDGRWPLRATLSSLLNAPVLERWKAEQFERLLHSEAISRYSDDDLSLALIRRVAAAGEGATEVEGLALFPLQVPSVARPAWGVRGCSDLLAVRVDPAVPPGAAISSRSEQVWDRSNRYAPVSWPIRRIGADLVLVPRPPSRASSLREVADNTRRSRRSALRSAVGSCVEALHEAGLAHGGLTVDCFAVLPDGAAMLCDPGPGMFDGGDRGDCRARDLEFLAGPDLFPGLARRSRRRRQGRTGRSPRGHRG